MVLWRDIQRREHKTDFGLAKLIGLSNGTVSQWRANKVKGVLPDVLTLIETKLGYKIRLTEQNEWQITKLGEPETPVKQNTSTYTSNGGEAKHDIGESAELIQVLREHGLHDVNKLRRFLRQATRLQSSLQHLCEDFDDVSDFIELNTDKIKKPVKNGL